MWLLQRDALAAYNLYKFFMINLFNHYQNNWEKDYLTKKDSEIQKNCEKDQHSNSGFYISSIKEWFNSYYSYNKASSKALVAKNSLVNKVMESYANMLQIKRTVFNHRKDNKLRYSANKIYTGKAKLEHTNNKVTIKLTAYNKKKAFFEQKVIRFIMLIKFWKIRVANKNIYIPYYKNRLLHVVKRNFFLFNKWNTAFFKEKPGIFSYLLKTKWRNFHFDDYIPMIKKARAAHLHSSYNTNNYGNRRLKKICRLEKTFSNYKENIHFNTSLFTPILLCLNKLGVLSFLQKIWENFIEIQLTEARAVHTDSDIISSAVSLKLRDRKNNALRILGKAVKMVKIPYLHTLITFDDSAETLNKNNVINYTKQQIVSGIRLEASGRLTRRLTAMRAVFKYRYAGSLKNIRSSFNNESATMLRGCLKSNLQHSSINSKTRNGTFGLKNWLSSHMFNFSLSLLFSRYIGNPVTQLHSLPLHSGMFTINKKFVVGLISSIITAAVGYGIKWILLNHMEYDVFANLDNWRVSLSYFCSLGAIRFVVGEFVNQQFFFMYSSIPGSTGPSVTNITSPVASSRGLDNPVITSSSMNTNSNNGTTDQNTTGIGSSAIGDASTTQDRQRMEELLAKKEKRFQEFIEQYLQAEEDFNEVNAEKPDPSNFKDWERRRLIAKSAYDDTATNAAAEQRMCRILKAKLENGNYSADNTSVLGKRNTNSFSSDLVYTRLPTRSER
jgi:hypothetical protein